VFYRGLGLFTLECRAHNSKAVSQLLQSKTGSIEAGTTLTSLPYLLGKIALVFRGLKLSPISKLLATSLSLSENELENRADYILNKATEAKTEQ
jgi:hypothetical protein